MLSFSAVFSPVRAIESGLGPEKGVARLVFSLLSDPSFGSFVAEKVSTVACPENRHAPTLPPGP